MMKANFFFCQLVENQKQQKLCFYVLLVMSSISSFYYPCPQNNDKDVLSGVFKCKSHFSVQVINILQKL